MSRGVWRHFLLSLRLNARNRQALVYGYVVPIFFLLAFGSVFQGDTPPLMAQMGQLLTITILGGACFGLPTTLVSERERGVWRRYRLLPVSVGRLVVNVLAARMAIVASAAVLQLVLARIVYGTPLPANWAVLALGFFVVTVAFLGVGLLIAALANDVPAVQALGQAIFLPMIMIGGVGIPLAVLPLWSQRLAGFMPGRYAVELLQRGWMETVAWPAAAFDALALLGIGLAAAIGGMKLFRWESGGRWRSGTSGWLVGALAVWLAVGATAFYAGRLRPVIPAAAAWETITREQIGRITYEGLPDDNELVTRLGPPMASITDDRVARFAYGLKRWAPGRIDNAGQAVRNLVALAAVADLAQDQNEAEMTRLVFEHLRSRFEPADLSRALAWVILSPEEGTVVQQAPDLGLARHPPERAVRQRSVWYAQKFLGRIEGKIRERE